MINIDVLAAKALTEYEPLTTLLANGSDSVYHDDAPENGEYPILQYTAISETPAMHADNRAVALQKVIRVTVINSTNAGRHAFKEAIMKAMTDAGFMWQSTNTARSDSEFYLVMDFSYATVI